MYNRFMINLGRYFAAYSFCFHLRYVYIENFYRVTGDPRLDNSGCLLVDSDSQPIGSLYFPASVTSRVLKSLNVNPHLQRLICDAVLPGFPL